MTTTTRLLYHRLLIPAIYVVLIGTFVTLAILDRLEASADSEPHNLYTQESPL